LTILPMVPIESHVSLALVFYLPRPKALMRKRDPEGEISHTGRGDVDNFAKDDVCRATRGISLSSLPTALCLSGPPWERRLRRGSWQAASQ
jgi:hypothetical protein